MGVHVFLVISAMSHKNTRLGKELLKTHRGELTSDLRSMYVADCLCLPHSGMCHALTAVQSTSSIFAICHTWQPETNITISDHDVCDNSR